MAIRELNKQAHSIFHPDERISTFPLKSIQCLNAAREKVLVAWMGLS